MRVEQLSWHTYSNLQPTSISSEKHSYHCAALQPCRASLPKTTVMAGAKSAAAGRWPGQAPPGLGEELEDLLALIYLFVTQLSTSTLFSLVERTSGLV